MNNFFNLIKKFNENKTLRWLFSRTFVVYCVIFIFFNLLTNETKLKMHALNHSIPSFKYLINFSEKKEEFNKDKFKVYERYYSRVIRYFPDIASGYGMLGYSSYYLGKERKAIFLYKKAIKINTDFLLFHYNLGVIYFKNKKYLEASELFNKAINTELAGNIYTFYNCLIYRQLLTKDISQLSNDDIEKRIVSDYSRSYLFLVLCYHFLGDLDKMKEYSIKGINPHFESQDFFNFYAGLSSYELKEYPEAISYFKECIKLNPDFADAYYYAGLCLKINRQEEKAEKFLKKAIILKKLKNISILDDINSLKLL